MGRKASRSWALGAGGMTLDTASVTLPAVPTTADPPNGIETLGTDTTIPDTAPQTSPTIPSAAEPSADIATLGTNITMPGTIPQTPPAIPSSTAFLSELDASLATITMTYPEDGSINKASSVGNDGYIRNNISTPTDTPTTDASATSDDPATVTARTVCSDAKALPSSPSK